MKKYLKPLLEEIIVIAEDVILASKIEVSGSNASYGDKPNEIF